MPDYNNFNNNMGDVVTGVETVKKSHTGLIAGIVAVVTAGAVTVVAGGGVAAYCLSDFVKNQVKMRVSSPEKYYAWINEENANDFAKKFAESYQKGLDKIDEGQTTNFSVKYEPTDDLKDLIIDEMDLDDEYEEDSQVIDIIQNIDYINLGAEGQTKNSLIDGSLYVDLNSDRLVTCEIASDSSAMDYFVRIPELTEKWLGVDAGKLIEENSYDDSEKTLIESYKKAMQDPASVITPEEIELEAARYVKVWNDCVGDVTLNKKETVTINDIDMNYAVVSVEIDEKKAHEIAKNFIESAKDDELLKEIMVDRLGAVSSKEYDNALDEALDEINDAAEENFGDEVITVNTYIDAKGKIRGVKVTGEDDYEEFMAIIGKDGDKVRGESYLLDGDKEPEFEIELTADGVNDVYSGNINFTSDDETASIEFDDFEIVNKDFGYFNAKTKFTIPDVDDPIAIDFTTDGDSQSIAGDVIIDGTDYGRITFTIGVKNGADPEIPSKNKAVMLDEPGEMEDVIKEYVTRDEFEDFVRDILEKIGLEEDLADDSAKAIGKNVFDSHKNNYDWDDDDYDYDYDWDDDDSSSAPKTTTKSDSSSKSTTTTTTATDTTYSFDSDDYISPEYDEAYIIVADKQYSQYYLGFGSNDLAKGSKFATVNGNGTYTVSIDAGDSEPNGFSVLGIALNDAEEEAKIKIKSVKIDGKDIAIENDAMFTNEFGLEAFIYADPTYIEYLEDELDDFKNAINADNIGKWKTIEITFEITDNE